MLTFLLSPLGKLAMYAVGIVAIIGAFWAFIAVKEHEAATAATAAFIAQQQAEIVKEQQQFQKDQTALQAAQTDIVNQVQKLNDALSDIIQDGQDAINNSKAGTTLDPIFNELLHALKGIK